MKSIYGPYLGTIERALNKKKSNILSKSLLGSAIGSSDKKISKIKIKEGVDFTPSTDLMHLSKLIGVTRSGSGVVGKHPDFVHLIDTRESEYHNIISSFIDIKGSTNLYKDYDHEEIYTITNTILTAAIHTCHLFGGNIQRLQGDGVFSYFGGRGINESDALLHSLTAAASFTYFVKNDLKRVFLLHGIEDINTRIGIDIGENHDDVLWVVTGSETCFELTTLSLHTSLAYKAQQKASENGIIVGRHVKNKLTDLGSYFSELPANKPFENKYNYSLYRFDWYSFLKSLPFIMATGVDELEFFTNETEDQTNPVRLDRLRETSLGSFLTNDGKITNEPTGVKIQPNRFHYDKDQEGNK